MPDSDPYDLARFVTAQEPVYENVVRELQAGRKRTHWMWFIFPQIHGLGSSATAKHYAIKSLDEAREYLHHPVLGKRLRECAEYVAAIEGRLASEIFGFPDDVKFRSCCTLFAHAGSETESKIFRDLISKYFGGEYDSQTTAILGQHGFATKV